MSNQVIFDPLEINEMDSLPINNLFCNTQRFEDLHKIQHQEIKEPSENKIKTSKSQRKNKILRKSQDSILNNISSNLSYVSRKRKENGHHLIKIHIYELVPGIKRRNFDDSDCLNAQYVVEDDYDEIMECAESLVSKIAKKLSISNSFRL